MTARAKARFDFEAFARRAAFGAAPSDLAAEFGLPLKQVYEYRRRAADRVRHLNALRGCAARGLTRLEAIEETGLSSQRIARLLHDNPDIRFAAPKPRPPGSAPVAKPRQLRRTDTHEARLQRLPARERADYDLLVRRGGYAPDVAFEMVTRPKVRIRAVPPDGLEARP